MLPLSNTAAGLLRAVMADEASLDDAAAMIAGAERNGVDLLEYCAHELGHTRDVIWKRAANWAHFPFRTSMPPQVQSEAIHSMRGGRLDRVKMLIQKVDGREMGFAAPDFVGFLDLAQARQDQPGLRQRLTIVAPDVLNGALQDGARQLLVGHARGSTAELWPESNAFSGLPDFVRLTWVLLVAGMIIAIGFAGAVAKPAIAPLAAGFMLLPGLVRLLAALPAFRSSPRPVRPLVNADLPIYSVMLPLRDEASMVPQLAATMRALDYPPEKLDLLFVVESRSQSTVAAVETVLGDLRFRMVEVPDVAPRTKPKALNYALPFCRGEYVVVYDAEDSPEPDQLRLAASRFAADPELCCLQAELVPDNALENWLTSLFAGEYAGLFGRLLPALARWRLPLPLGGTSNHFRTSVLRSLGGWDAFNVAEDADIGVRLARRRLKVEAFTSRTYEEAPITLDAWMAQRTRWMKGWMQTFIVHNRQPRLLLRQLGWRSFLGFEILIGGMILSSVLHSAFAAVIAWTFLTQGLAGLQPRDVFDWLTVGALLAGYGGALAVVVSGILHIETPRLLRAQLLLPVYWVFHSAAAVLAAIDLVRRPTYWAKTTHGLSHERHQPLTASRQE